MLGPQQGTLHVHLVAPVEDRAGRIAARDRISPDEARRRIAESDEGRRRYVWGAGQRDWDDPILYDLIVNTHRLALDAAAGLIVEAARRSGVAGDP